MENLLAIVKKLPPYTVKLSLDDPLVQTVLESLWSYDQMEPVFPPSFLDFRADAMHLSFNLREIYTSNGIWGIPCRESITDIAKFADGPILEVMGGTGYLAYWLQVLEHVDVICTDKPDNDKDGWCVKDSKKWTFVEPLRASKAVLRYPGRAVLASWIPYTGCDNQDEVAMLKNMTPGQKLILIGEGQGGCTASEEFFEYLDEHFEPAGGGRWLPAMGLHDRLEFFVKR